MLTHKLLLSALVFLLFCSMARAQEAYKMDDVTRLRCDLGELPQLDEAGMQMVQKKAKAIFILYGRKGQVLRYIEYLKIHFLKLRFPKEDFSKNLSLIYGGYAEHEKMEIWIIPQGAKRPEFSINNTNTEKTLVIFDDYGYWYQYCPDTRIPALKVFANELKQNPNLNGYIVVHYSDSNSEEIKGEKDAKTLTDIRKGQRASVTDKIFLTKLGVKPSRILIIDIDYNKSFYASHAELWIIPQNSIPKLVLMNEN